MAPHCYAPAGLQTEVQKLTKLTQEIKIKIIYDCEK